MQPSDRRETSRALYEQARQVMPGGVNSPARAYDEALGPPPFIKSAEGPYVYDEDGNRYTDFVLTWGPAILGHANDRVVEAAANAVEKGSSFGAPTEAETEMAEKMIERVPGLDKVRLVNSGTEACMSAIRLARGTTGRDKFIKFDGCYHGHGDSFLIAAGSGALTLENPDSPGVTEGTASDTLVAKFNDIDSVAELVDEHRGDIAAVILEPICGNAGVIPPNEGFLDSLRELCDREDIVLIFDEVMTGFRVAKGGAAEYYGVTPDLYTFGKVLGAGFPLAAFGGKAEYMADLAPEGPVYQAGTLSGNPVAVAAGNAMLDQLDTEVYEALEERGEQLEEGLHEIIEHHDYPLSTHRVGSMFSVFFTEGPIERKEDVSAYDREKFHAYFRHLLDSGVYIAPSQFESGFLSTAHTPRMIDDVLETIDRALEKTFDDG